MQPVYESTNVTGCAQRRVRHQTSVSAPGGRSPPRISRELDVWCGGRRKPNCGRLASPRHLLLFRTGPSQSWRDILLSWRWDPVTNQSQGVCVWHPRLPVVLLLRLCRWTAPVHDEATPRRDRSCRGRGALPHGYQQDCWLHSTLLIMAELSPPDLPPK